MNSEDLLAFLVENGRAWVKQQRDYHRPGAKALTVEEKAALRPFFTETLVEAARVKRVAVIENPEFYEGLAAIGVGVPLNFREMSGITFVDTVLISQLEHPHDPPELSLLFHELVHCAQYEALGVDVFIERYVHGWAGNGQDYYAIPLERDAYELQERFEQAPTQAFLVKAEVLQRLGLA